MIKRTSDEMKGIILGLQQHEITPGYQLWEKELKIYQEKLIAINVNAQGEEAVRFCGQLKGIGLALNLSKILANESNVGNSTILKK